MRTLLTLLTTGVLASLLGCASLDRDKEFYKDRVQRILDTEVVLNTKTKAINPNDEEKPYSYETTGNGFVVGNYVFTAEHVVSRYSITYPTPFGPYTEELDKIEERTFIDDIQINPIIEDRKKDVAIFDLSKTPKLCKKYCNGLTLKDIVTSGELYNGMEVFWMASPDLRGDFYRSSHISSIREVKGYEEKGIKDFLDNSFSINIAFRNGTSGKPLWSYEGDKLKVVGVGHYNLDELGYAKLMDEYVEAIKKYEEAKK